MPQAGRADKITMRYHPDDAMVSGVLFPGFEGMGMNPPDKGFWPALASLALSLPLRYRLFLAIGVFFVGFFPGSRIHLPVDRRLTAGLGGLGIRRSRIGSNCFGRGDTGFSYHQPFAFRMSGNTIMYTPHAIQASADMLTIPPPTRTVVDEPRANAPTHATTIPTAAIAAIATRARFTLSRHQLAGAVSRRLVASGVVSVIRLSMLHILRGRHWQSMSSRVSIPIISERGIVGNFATAFLLVHHQPAVHVDGLAGDVARSGTREERRHRRDILRFIRSTDRYVRRPLRLQFVHR